MIKYLIRNGEIKKLSVMIADSVEAASKSLNNPTSQTYSEEAKM